MRLLPPLVTPAGVFALPLWDRTAEQLIGALLTTDPRRREERLEAVLGEDASLALWTVCRAAQSGQTDARDAGQLARWLAGTVVAELLWSDSAWPSSAIPAAGAFDAWADLAAKSAAVALRSATIAEREGLDLPRAHLLGLLHAGPLWFASGEAGGNRILDAGVLPAWLTEDLNAIGTDKTGRVVSPADAVAAAARAEAGNASQSADGGTYELSAGVAPETHARDRWRLNAGAAEQLQVLTHWLRRLERLKKREQQFEPALEAAKLESLKELAYGAGHEINNPLANISARAQTLLAGERDPDRRRMLASIHTQAFRAHEMIADMMLFARPPQPKLESVDLVPLLTAVGEELAPLAREQNTQLAMNLPSGPLKARVDPTQIAVAARALCVNALEALVSGGRVELALSLAAARNGHPENSTLPSENIQIAVSDNGPGIPPEVRRQMFDPFYSGREAGRGLGFGLSKCWRIVTMHGGQIDVETSPGNGARLIIWLPSSQGP